MDFSRIDSEFIKIYLAAFAAALGLLFFLLSFFQDRLPAIQKRILNYTLNILLIVLVALSFLNYSRALSRQGIDRDALSYIWRERVDAYDLVHYYLVPKYFRELGYFNLYPAAIAADLEAGGPYFKYDRDAIVLQNEKDYYWVDRREYLKNQKAHEEAHSHFSKERWENFSHDFLYIQRDITGFSRRTWNDMLWDHGFNGTPLWVGLVHYPLQFISVESLKMLCYVDVFFLSIATLSVIWAFGWKSAFFLLVFLFTTYSARWPTFSWAFGRYDWVSLLVISMALLKRAHPFIAGICTGCAAAFRVFPLFWLFGPFFISLFHFFSNKKLHQEGLRIFAGFALSITLLSLLSFIQFGAKPMHTYLKKMTAHTAPKNLSSMRTGFALAAAYKGERNIERMDEARRNLVAKQAKWRTPLALIFVALFGLALRKKSTYEAFAFGLVPFFFLSTASYYYYIVRAPLIALHAYKLQKGQLMHCIGCLFLFGIEAMSNYLQIAYPKGRVIHIGWLAWMCGIYCVTMLVFLVSKKEAPSISTNKSFHLR